MLEIKKKKYKKTYNYVKKKWTKAEIILWITVFLK